jgi:chaperone modulatory protein CbpM
MLITFEEVIAEVELDHVVLSAWIEQNWVLPVEKEGRYYFDEADVARVRLIAELTHDLGVNDEAMPVILRLLDQVYGLYRALDNLNAAIKRLPEPARAQLKEELEKITDEADGDG